MNIQAFIDTDSALVADDKGLLAMFESMLTCHKHFVALGIFQSQPCRRNHRERLMNSTGLGDCEPPSHNLIRPISSLPALTADQHSKKDVA